jgi:hypothetical protein
VMLLASVLMTVAAIVWSAGLGLAERFVLAATGLGLGLTTVVIAAVSLKREPPAGDRHDGATQPVPAQSTKATGTTPDNAVLTHSSPQQLPPRVLE